MEHSEQAVYEAAAMDAAMNEAAHAGPDGELSGGMHEAEAPQEEGHAPAPQSAAEQAQQPGQAEEQDEAQAVRAHIAKELESLLADGWTQQQLQAFAADEQAQRVVGGGMSARRAATAYLMRMAQEPPRPVKRAVPAIKTATAGSVPRTHAIERMSSSEFARFSDGLYERLLAGEKITL